jgi:glycosyltransferase involved in cell wall biosynthesis
MDKEEPLIYIHQGIMTSYRIPGYNKILEANKGLNILYGQPDKNSSLQNGDIPNNNRYIKIKNIYLSQKKEFFFAKIFRIIFINRPNVIVTQYSFSNLSIWGLYIIRPFLKFKIIGWNHGWDRRMGFNPKTSVKDRVRLFMLRQADAMIFYSEDALEKLSKYTNREKLFVANNTLDTTPLLDLKSNFKKSSKQELKKELGFTSKYNLIFSARLEPAKKPKKLIVLFKELQKSINDISMHIIGSGSLETELKQMVSKEKIANIKFYGAIYDNELTGKMIYCSDLMIIPSWVGLSIVHSFCFDCPLITFERDFHPPEIIYLKNEKTGYNLWDKSDIEAAEIISNFLLDSDLQIKFKKNMEKVIQNEASISKFVSGATNAIDFCLNQS